MLKWRNFAKSGHTAATTPAAYLVHNVKPFFQKIPSRQNVIYILLFDNGKRKPFSRSNDEMSYTPTHALTFSEKIKRLLLVLKISINRTIIFNYRILGWCYCCSYLPTSAAVVYWDKNKLKKIGHYLSSIFYQVFFVDFNQERSTNKKSNSKKIKLILIIFLFSPMNESVPVDSNWKTVAQIISNYINSLILFIFCGLNKKLIDFKE